MEKVRVFAALPNHYSFYESLRRHFLAESHCDVAICGGHGGKNPHAQLALINVIRIIRRERNAHWVLEEYLGPKALLAAVITSRVLGGSVSLAVHNLNSWAMLRGPNSIKRIVKYLVKSVITKAARQIIVVSEELRAYAEEVIPGKEIITVPFQSFVANPATIGRSRAFCIPGNVEEGRRDYWTVFDAFEEARGLGSDVQLELLGVYLEENVSKKFADRIRYLRNTYRSNFLIYESFVAKELFDIRVREARALIGNVVQFQHYSDCVEIYGLTKETGVRALAEAYGKVCLIPRYIPISRSSDRYVSYSSPSELAQCMSKLATT